MNKLVHYGEIWAFVKKAPLKQGVSSDILKRKGGMCDDDYLGKLKNDLDSLNIKLANYTVTFDDEIELN